jgi:type II secretory pathway pseudopilin PulG
LRWLSALLSYATLYGGFLMALFTARKETLHDKITGTQVVDRWAYTEWPDRQRDGLGGCGVAAAVGGGILLLVGLIGIVAAIALPAYQDYVGRAKVAEVLAAANVAKVLVDEHMANQGQCPDDLETLGASSVIGTDGSLALGSNKGGRCRLEITLPSTAGTLSHQRLWLDREADGRWVCGADFDGKYLPASCRYPALPGPGA